MKYNDLINELLDLLDKNEDIKKIKILKENLLKDNVFLKQLDDYKLFKTVEKKQKLFENKDYKEYLIRENNINLLILNIKNKFNIISSRKCIKWKL